MKVVWAPQPGAQEALIHCPYREIGFGGSRGGGKGLCAATLIPSQRGWITMENVRVGDYLYDDKGNLTKVLYKSDATYRDCYRITFDNGEQVIADDVHRWLTYSKAERASNAKLSEEYRAKRRANRASRAKTNPKNKGSQLTVTQLNKSRVYQYKQPSSGTVRNTSELLATLKVQNGREVNHAIKLALPLNCEHKNLPIPPYILGLWLGDGSSASGSITIGEQDFAVINKEINAEGFEIRRGKDITHRLARKNSTLSFTSELRALNLIDNKHVPAEYEQGNYEQRLALLQGLFDTDGCCNKDGQVEFTNTNHDIALSVYKLLSSCGVKAFLTSRQPLCTNAKGGAKRGATAYTVKATTMLNLFRLERKGSKLPTKLRETQRWHYITNIEPVPTVKTYCIEVDSPSHLFLITKSFIPTHNTAGVLGKFGIKASRYGKGFNAIFFRREMPQADDLIEEAKEIYLPLGSVWQEQKKQFYFANGARIRFRPLENVQDAEKYQGQNISDAAVEEAGNYPDPAPIDRMFGVLRSKTGLPTQLILTFNPGGAGHTWLKKRFIDPAPMGWTPIHTKLANGAMHTRIYIPSRVTDNKILLLKDPNYITNLHLVGSPELVRAWLEGDFNIVAGAYFPEFKQSHVIAPFPIPRHWTKYMGFDWGYHSPFCAVWGAISSGKDDSGKEVPYPKGSLIIYREWSDKGLDNPEIGKGLKERTVESLDTAVADPSIFAHEGGQSIAQQIQQGGFHFREADNERISGWSQIRMRLKAEPHMIYFFSTCKYLIETLPTLPIDTKRPEDLDTKADDHGADALRYLCKIRPIEPVYLEKSQVAKLGTVHLDKLIADYKRSMQRSRV